MAEHVNGEIIDGGPESTALARTTGQGSSGEIMAVLKDMAQRGVTNENAEAMGKMVALFKDLKAMDARESFFAAKSKLRQTLPHIVARKEVKKRDGTVMYRYAPYDEMMTQIEGHLTAAGFDISYDITYDGAGADCRCRATLKLTYGGHTECNSFAARVSPPSEMLTAAQMDMKARTTARRGALADCLNIVIDYDDDARMEGAAITPAQAAELERRLKATGSDRTMFLRFAGAKDFADILASKMPVIEAAMKAKEQQKARPQPQNRPVEHDPNTGEVVPPHAQVEAEEAPQ